MKKLKMPDISSTITKKKIASTMEQMKQGGVETMDTKKKIDISGPKRAICKVGLKIKKYSPQILTVCGVAGVVGTVAFASHAGIRVHDEIMPIMHSQLNEVKQGLAFSEEEMEAHGLTKSDYTEQDARKDTFIIYAQAGLRILDIYLPTIICAGSTIACFLGAEKILNDRYAGALALAEATTAAYAGYRDRVKEQFGEDVENNIFNNRTVEKKKVKVESEDGKTHTETEEEVTIRGEQFSPYARIFDETNPNWSFDSSQNKMFLECVEKVMNDRLVSRGYLFLNEVYDALGFTETSYGQLVGWLYGYGGRDQKVDFQIWNMNVGNPEQKIRFINGDESSVVLDFNVDGVIYDCLDGDDEYYKARPKMR